MWARANLGGIGAMGDAALAASCVPSPGEYNNQRVICGGILFADAAYALTWPGAAMIEDEHTVNNTLPSNPLPAAFPMFGMEPGPKPAATPAEAAMTGRALAPSTLVTPLPTITPIPPDRTGDDSYGFGCHVQHWATSNPALAVLLAAGVYWAFKNGGKR